MGEREVTLYHAIIIHIQYMNKFDTKKWLYSTNYGSNKNLAT